MLIKCQHHDESDEDPLKPPERLHTELCCFLRAANNLQRFTFHMSYPETEPIETWFLDFKRKWNEGRQVHVVEHGIPPKPTTDAPSDKLEFPSIIHLSLNWNTHFLVQYCPSLISVKLTDVGPPNQLDLVGRRLVGIVKDLNLDAFGMGGRWNSSVLNCT